MASIPHLTVALRTSSMLIRGGGQASRSFAGSSVLATCVAVLCHALIQGGPANRGGASSARRLHAHEGEAHVQLQRHGGAALASPDQVAPSQNMLQVSHVGGVVQAIGLGQDHVYIGIGRRVGVASIADGQDPVLLGSSDELASVVSQLVVFESTIYAACGSQIVVLERDVMERLSVLSTIMTPNQASVGGIAVQFPLLFVAVGELGLQVIDIRNPRAPTQISLWDPDGSKEVGNVKDVALEDGLAFLADSGVGLRVVDVTDPQRPILVGTASRPAPQPAIEATAVAVEGKQAFVAAMQGGLVVFDVGTPSNPEESAVVPIVGLNGGRYVDVAVDRQRAYAVHWVDSDTRNGGIAVIERGRVTAPAKRAHISGIPRAMVIRDNVAYVAASNGLRVADLSDPRNLARSSPDAPLETAALRIPAGGFDVAIDGRKVVMAEVDPGVALLDVDEQGELTGRSSVDRLWETRAVDLRWPLAFVASLDVGLRSIDMSREVPLVVAQSESAKGWPLSLQVLGEHAYVAYKDALRIFPVGSNGSLGRPRNLGFTSLSQFTAHDGIGVSVEEGMGLRTWVVSPEMPQALTELGRYAAPTGAAMLGAEVQGSHLYVTGYKSCLQILDISDPSSVRPVGELLSPCHGRRVAVSEDRAFVVGFGQVVAIDVSLPSSPKIIGYRLLADAADVVMAGEDALVGTSNDGIYTLRFVSPTPTPTASSTPTPSTTTTASRTPGTGARTPTSVPSASGPLRSVMLPALSRAALINTPPPAATATGMPTAPPPPSATPVLCALAEAEPNDLPSHALGQPVLCDGQAIEGSIEGVRAPDSADYYTMLVDRDQKIRIRMSSITVDRETEVDLGLWKCRADGCSQVGWSGRRATAEETIDVALAMGTYFVSAQASGPQGGRAAYRLAWGVFP